MAEVIKKQREKAMEKRLQSLRINTPILLCLTQTLRRLQKQEYLKRLIRKDFLIAELQRQI